MKIVADDIQKYVFFCCCFFFFNFQKKWLIQIKFQALIFQKTKTKKENFRMSSVITVNDTLRALDIFGGYFPPYIPREPSLMTS